LNESNLPEAGADQADLRAPVSPEAIRAQLNQILTSQEFAHAESLKRFLHHAVEQVLQGRGDRLKEYALGVELFGRGESFDPRLDPIVRVQAGKLRSRLQQYYSAEGRADQVLIEFPKGGYVPLFRRPDAVSVMESRPAAGRPRRRTLLAAGVLVSAALAVAVAWLKSGAPSPPAVFTQLTFATGATSAFPAISREGKILAFASDRDEGGNLDIYIQAIGLGGPVRLTSHGATERQPDISPDGTRIAFQSGRDGGGIYVLSLLSREEKRIAERGFLPRFSPDGNWVSFQGDNKLFVVPSNGGQAREIPSDLRAGRLPLWTPDGKHLLALVGGGEGGEPEFDWRIVPLSGGRSWSAEARETFRRHRLGTSRYPPTPGDWIADHLIFSAGQGETAALWRIPMSKKTWRVAGAPQRLTSGPGSHTWPRAAAETKGPPRVVFTNENITTHIWALSMDPDRPQAGGELRQITRDASLRLGEWGSSSQLSADGTRLVFCSARSGNPDVWLKDLQNGVETSLATNPWPEEQPLMAPDGAKVAYVSREKPGPTVYVAGTAGGRAEKVCESCGSPLDWTADGRRMLLAAGHPPRLLALDLAAGERRKALAGLKYTLREAALSPDGLWIAIRADGLEDGGPFLAPFRALTVAQPAEWIRLVELRGASGLRWSPSGRWIYFFSRRDGFHCIWAQALHPRSKRPLGSPTPVYHFHRYQRHPSSDSGMSIAVDKLSFWLGESASSIWMIEISPLGSAPLTVNAP
jgi:Tol biopolymer transport system component